MRCCICPLTSVHPLCELVSSPVNAVCQQEDLKLSETSDMGLFKRKSYLNRVYWKFSYFCAKDALSLPDFLHQQVDVLLLLLQHLLQSVDLSLVFQEFPLKTMIFLLQNLTNSLYSGRQSAHYPTRHYIHTYTSRCYFCAQWPHPAFLQTVIWTGSVNQTQEEFNSITEEQIHVKLQLKQSLKKSDVLLLTNTCSGCPCLISSSEETPAARSASALETPCHSCLWTNAWEAGLDQS